MAIYLGLGSNQGDRRGNLEAAISSLNQAGFTIDSVSPMVESPAMLPPDAEAAWNKPFLNLVVSGTAHWSPEYGLQIAKQIEREMGRESGPRWSPRPIDIDLLVWHEEVVQSKQLTIPHPGIADRDFVITPLMYLAPGLEIPGLAKSVFELSLGRKNIPLWMGILNITPDSFSDGDSWSDTAALESHLDKLLDRDIQIIDIGAESTRPRAESLDDSSEWQRLQPVLTLIQDRVKGRRIKPQISVDSRHPKVVARALEYGIDIINDVTGLNDPEMRSVARDSDCQVVAMHSMSVPVDPSLLLPSDKPPLVQIKEWIEEKKNAWQREGLNLDRIIIDPGIGFGKTSIQAYDLMSQCAALRGSGFRLLIGHSRKSFMNGISDRPPGQRDLETLGISMGLCQQGVDIIRVHQPFIHQRAYRAWAHLSLQ
ncbi:MAG: dihydropteroate synthase [Acidiferrobacterales bacterium]|nr:dihydropteroate synthase [Acidiferrobacterales bacterium]